MRQVLIKKGGVVVENIPAPFVDDNGVLVEVAYSLISTGTEMTGVEESGKPLLKRALEKPERVQKLITHLRQQGIQKTIAKVQGQLDGGAATGYSCAGIVVQVGKNVIDIQPGDRVACAGAGKANHAELVVVPRNLLVKIPEGCSLKEAATVTLGAIAMQGVRRADPRLGDVVAIIGLGLIGQITTQLLRISGCRVIGLDLDARRVELAQKLGVDFGFLPSETDVLTQVKNITAGYGVDSAIITAGSQSDAIVQQAMEITRKKGRVVVVGAVGLGLKRSPFYEKELDFLISCSYGPGRYDNRYEEQGLDYPYAYVRWTENRNMAEYLRLIAEGKFNAAPLVEREYDVADAPQAYGELKTAADKPLGVLLAYGIDSDDLARKQQTKVVLRQTGVTGKIKVALAGAGGFAKGMHLPNMQALSGDYHLRAVMSRTGHNATATAKQFEADYAATEYQQILDDLDVDLVLIATRHNLHAEMVLQALQAGKHVFVEKPLAVTPAGLESIEAFYQQNASAPLLMTGFNRRFAPAIQRAGEILANRTTPIIMNYRMNAGYIPLDHWVHNEEGGGRNIGEACHIYDLFNFFTNSQVTDIQAISIAPNSEQWVKNDNFVATVKYSDGSVCTLTYTALGNTAYPKEQMEIYAEGKVISMDDYKLLTVTGGQYKGWSAATTQKGQKEELVALAKYLKNGGGWPISLEQQVQATQISFEVERLIFHK